MVRIDPVVLELRKARQERNMTQVQLAELSGLTRDLIVRTENGANSPNLYTIRKMATALGLDLKTEAKVP